MGKGDTEVKAMDASWSAISDLEPEAQRRVLTWLIDKSKLAQTISLPGLSGGGPNTASAAGAGAAGTSTSGLTPKQFMAQKKASTDAERITCLAYFMTHHRDTQQFKTKDLTILNTQAAGLKFSNPAVAVNNASLSGYLAAAGGGAKQITARGEALVEALPDRERVKAAMEENPVRRRKVSRGKRGKPA